MLVFFVLYFMFSVSLWVAACIWNFNDLLHWRGTTLKPFDGFFAEKKKLIIIFLWWVTALDILYNDLFLGYFTIWFLDEGIYKIWVYCFMFIFFNAFFTTLRWRLFWFFLLFGGLGDWKNIEFACISPMFTEASLFYHSK